MTNNWKKIGRRSLKHRGYPRMVVRFYGSKGKGKLLSNATEFAQREMEAGRVPETTLATLVKDAEAAWKEIDHDNPVEF